MAASGRYRPLYYSASASALAELPSVALPFCSWSACHRLGSGGSRLPRASRARGFGASRCRHCTPCRPRAWSPSTPATGALRVAETDEVLNGSVLTLDGEDDEEAYGVKGMAEEATSEDTINATMAARPRPPNCSYFAFTATPKSKTLELFGRPDLDGKPAAFHIYSMRQAIEEGFILDVLKNYLTYKAFYKLTSQADDKWVPHKKAQVALARYAKLHPHNISQKVAVIVEHFRAHVATKLKGQAKAMVVTDSRVAAVRYKLAMDRYLKDRGYTDMKTLVAFSGRVTDLESGPEDFTEVNMNPGIRGRTRRRALRGRTTGCYWSPTNTRRALTGRSSAPCTSTSAWAACSRCRRCLGSIGPIRARRTPLCSIS